MEIEAKEAALNAQTVYVDTIDMPTPPEIRLPNGNGGMNRVTGWDVTDEQRAAVEAAWDAWRPAFWTA